MKPLARNALFVLCAAGLVASVVAGREKPAGAEPPAPAARLEARIALDLEKLEARAGREDAGAPQADPFAQRSFAPPAEPAPRERPARPAAPPLPFAYLGKVIEDGKLSVFLARGGESLAVRPGETIGGEYRVDAVTETEIQFTYLPLKTKQSLPL